MEGLTSSTHIIFASSQALSSSIISPILSAYNCFDLIQGKAQRLKLQQGAQLPFSIISLRLVSSHFLIIKPLASYSKIAFASAINGFMSEVLSAMAL